MRCTQVGARIAALVMVLSGTALPARAQDYPELRPGQAVQGTLAEADPTLSDRGRFRVYRFDAAAGTRYILTVDSDDFDPYVSVARLVRGLTDIVDADDDGGEGTNARLRWTAETAGTYLVIAQAYGEDGVGDFTVKVEAAPRPTTAQSRPVQVGQPVDGVLAETDAVLEEDDSFYDTYTLRARRGQRLVVEMESDSFDTFLHFGRLVNDQWEPLEADDDGGEGTDSRLRVTVAEDGDYAIRANALGGGETGPYRLVVRERPPAPVAVAQPLRVGATTSGELTDADPVLEHDEIYYDLYTVQGRRGQRVQVDMTSSDFDTYLDAGQMRDGVWHSVRTDDDAGDGTNARLRLTLPEEGTYLLRARAFSDDATGSYSLSTRALPAPAPVRPRAVTLGQSVRGRLAAEDAVLPDEEINYDVYTVRATAGQRLNVEMRSDSFDTYLELGRMRNDRWESLRTDDDGSGQGTDSRLRFTVEEPGEYWIRARSYSAGATGPYTLVVTERPAGQATPARPIRAGETLQGTLEDTDHELADGSFYDVFTYAGRAGEEITVTLDADGFDAFLHVGRSIGGNYEEIATDDDGGDGTNSRLVLTLTADGGYVIRANSLGAGQTGDYRVRVTSSRDR